MPDFTDTLTASKPLEHLLEFFCFHGRPTNQDEANPVSVIVNHGYAVGFCPNRYQPLWAAYQVSAATRDVDYRRPELFYDDPRLPSGLQIGTRGFGKVGNKAYDRGHMVPNFAINTQFGRIAQSETFFMSNIVPQEANTNRGVWQRLEKLIIRDFAPAWEHIWALVGPVFGENPRFIERAGGIRVPIPKSFFMILVDPVKFPHDMPKNVRFLALEVPQNTGYKDPDDSLVTTVGAIEAATKLTFFPKLTNAQKRIVAERTSTRMWDHRNLDNPPD